MTETNVIVGAGQAGGWAAVTMRKHGFTGRIVLVGDEANLPYERPPLSKAVLMAEAELPAQLFRAREAYDALAIELRLGVTVIAIDAPARTTQLDDGSTLDFDRLLLATGGRARRLPMPGAEHAAFIRTHADALALRAAFARSKHVICIGAGVIGLECASSARALGCDVTVLEAGDVLMGRALPKNAAAEIQRLHERSGVRFIFGAQISSVVRDRELLSVALSDGRHVTGHCVVAGIGMERNTELAQKAGLRVQGGIITDEFGETSTPGIYAAGEVAAFWHPLRKTHVLMETWQHAQNHGVAVGRAMAGDPRPYDDLPWFWSDQHGVNLQVMGFPEEGGHVTMRHLNNGGFVMVYQADDDRIAGVVGFDSGREVRALQAVIQSAQPVDPAVVANPDIPFRHLKAPEKA
jgi:3-phenylpropionate/trans-cinnamate dioxygenase ferredoxin reductase component